MTIFLGKSVDNVAPSSFVLDLNTVPAVYNHKGPFWMSIDYWTSVADAAAGNFLADLNWLDSTGTANAINGGAISLAAIGSVAGGKNLNVGVVRLERFSATSLFEFNATLAGPAGTSLISYRIMHGPAAPTDIQGW
jgi:hypothetical protein